MEEHKLDDLLKAARMQYRVPPEADRERILSAIESEAWKKPEATRRRGHEWTRSWQLAAASLLIGVLAGRMSTRIGEAPAASMAAAPASTVSNVSAPYHQTSEEVLVKSAVLLAALRS